MFKEEICISEVPEETMTKIQKELESLKTHILKKFDAADEELFHPYKYPINCFLDGGSILDAAKECGVKLKLIDPLFEDISAVFAFKVLPVEDAEKIYAAYERRFEKTFYLQTAETRRTKRDEIVYSIDKCKIDYTRAILHNLDKEYFEHEIEEINKLIDLMFESVK